LEQQNYKAQQVSTITILRLQPIISTRQANSEKEVLEMSLSYGDSIESSSDINQRKTCNFTEQTFLKRPQLVSLGLRKHLLSYYLANKRSLHVHSQDLEIPTLIGENRKIKIYPLLSL